MTSPQHDVSTQLPLDGLDELLDARSLPRVGPPRPVAQRGPKGTRVGDVITADGSRWLVESLDPERREATCRLLGGGAYRRFRARAIRNVERTPTRIRVAETIGGVMEPNHPEDSNS
jgi:hypothetical protein